MQDRQNSLYWSLLYFLVYTEKYELVYYSDTDQEAWLESKQQKECNIIRFKRNSIDWGSSVRNDLIEIQPLVEQLKKRSFHKTPSFFNIYIAEYEPFDDWKETIEGMRLAAPMETYFFIENNIEQQRQFLHSSLLLEEEEITALYALQEENPLVLRQRLAGLLEYRNRQRDQILNQAKPIVTKILMTIQIAMFCLLEWNGGSTNTATLIHFGAKYNPLILQGEWWRFFTPMFLHIGFLHLLMNTVALYYIGTQVERIIGNSRFLFIYLFAGFSGSVVSFVTSNSVSAGASGAIFGCFSALLYIAFTYSNIFSKAVLQNVITLIVVNLVFGFVVPGIDNAGHIGGLLGGYLAALIVHVPKQKQHVWKQIIAIAVSISLLGGLLLYRINIQ